MGDERKASATMTPAAVHDRANFWHRRASATDVSDHAFAGRIGGNQEFIASDEDLLKKQPDAVSQSTRLIASNYTNDHPRHQSTTSATPYASTDS